MNSQESELKKFNNLVEKTRGQVTQISNNLDLVLQLVEKLERDVFISDRDDLIQQIRHETEEIYKATKKMEGAECK